MVARKLVPRRSKPISYHDSMASIATMTGSLRLYENDYSYK